MEMDKPLSKGVAQRWIQGCSSHHTVFSWPILAQRHSVHTAVLPLCPSPHAKSKRPKYCDLKLDRVSIKP